MLRRFNVLSYKTLRGWKKKKSGGAVNVSGGFNPPLGDLEAHQNPPLCFQCSSHHLQNYICVGRIPHTRSFRCCSRSPERDRSNTHASLPTFLYRTQSLSGSECLLKCTWRSPRPDAESLQGPFIKTSMTVWADGDAWKARDEGVGACTWVRPPQGAAAWVFWLISQICSNPESPSG